MKSLQCWHRKGKKGKAYTTCHTKPKAKAKSKTKFKPNTHDMPWYLRQNDAPNRKGKRKVVTPIRYR